MHSNDNRSASTPVGGSHESRSLNFAHFDHPSGLLVYMDDLIAWRSSRNHDIWASLLPFVQLAYNTSFSATVHETPFFIMFGRPARLPVDIIFGVPHVGRTSDTAEFSQKTRENLQLAFELARRNLRERLDAKAVANKQSPPYPVFQPGQMVLVHRPLQPSDGPNHKLFMPWRGPYEVCSQISPVVYRVKLPGDTKEVSVHLAHLKLHRPRDSPPAPDYEELSGFFLGQTIPVPDFTSPDTTQPVVGNYLVDSIVSHRPGRGRRGAHNYLYKLRFHGYGAECDIERRAHDMPQCHEMLAAYRIANNLEATSPPCRRPQKAHRRYTARQHRS